MKYYPLCECETEEKAIIIAKKFGTGYCLQSNDAKPYLVFGTSEQLKSFEEWVINAKK